MDIRRRECYARNSPNGTFGPADKFCELIFDGLLCWPATKAGSTYTQHCPYTEISYTLSTTLENAFKKCEDDGTWYVDPTLNRTWSNYSLCNLSMFDSETAIINFDISLDIAYYQTWIPIIKQISHVGYWISLITLLLSVIIFTSIKKLKCARNLLHVHLFISFIMRAVMFFIKEFVFVEGLALKSDLVAVKGKVEYTTEHYSWVCKAITSLRSYFIQANYMFTLMEGIYLHNLMFLNLFSDKSSIRPYYIFGWGIPLVFIGIWIKLRQIYDDKMCWTTPQNMYVSLLYQAPLEITVLLNFFLFLSITRVLCLKINTMYLQQRRIKYRRLIRSTLTLVLIYGVPFTISIAVSFCKNKTVEIVYLFFDQTFTAFQGLLMALIYCLLNSEVRSEVMHKYNSFRDKRQQDRRTRTISNTQQFTLPMQDEPFVDPPKNHHSNHHQQWYKNSNL